MTISENFIPDDAKNLLVGIEALSFDMSFIPTSSFPFVDDFEKWASFKQGKIKDFNYLIKIQVFINILIIAFKLITYTYYRKC